MLDKPILLERKKNEKGELQIIDLSTGLANVVEVRPGEYYKQPDLWMKAYDKVMSTKKSKHDRSI